nr:hypothetical protein [Buttiauxella gaviniae]
MYQVVVWQALSCAEIHIPEVELSQPYTFTPEMRVPQTSLCDSFHFDTVQLASVKEGDSVLVGGEHVFQWPRLKAVSSGERYPPASPLWLHTNRNVDGVTEGHIVPGCIREHTVEIFSETLGAGIIITATKSVKQADMRVYSDWQRPSWPA